jgi:hypothetical protein
MSAIVLECTAKALSTAVALRACHIQRFLSCESLDDRLLSRGDVEPQTR